MRFVATTTRGTEGVLSDELTELGIPPTRSDHGAVSFRGDLADAYRVCLHSRVASRVLLRLVEFRGSNPTRLYDGLRTVRWQDHVDPRRTMMVDFVGRSEQLRDTRFGAMKSKDAIVDTLRDAVGSRPDIDTRRPDLRVTVHLRGDQVTASIDLSGQPLFFRGHRRDGGPAPLKETLAASILRLAGWPEAAAEGRPLIDPMCGSGTFLTEAWGMASGRAAGLSRRQWGFEGWLGHDAAAWDEVHGEASAQSLRPVPELVGRDKDAKQVVRALENLSRAGIDSVRVEQGLVEDARPHGDAGLWVTNPPYGERLEQVDTLDATYRSIGDTLRRHFLGWTGWVLAGSPKLGRRFGLKPSKKIPLFNGPIECRLVALPISDRAPQRLQRPQDGANTKG